MRRYGLLTSALLIFLLSFNFFSAIACAQTENLSASSSSKPESKINYELPYPGLLPDNPLYFLRVIRDKAVSFMISDSLKKTEFNLLQADKRLNAGIYLFNKGKVLLALSTVSKAENYFSQALDSMGEARIQGRNINEMERNLRNALAKHQQELGNFIRKTNAETKIGFQKEQERAIGFEERLNR